jgi:hypothetical protein
MFALVLDDVQAGSLVSASGGDAEGVVVSEPSEGGVIRRRIEGLRYADIELTVDPMLSEPLSGWLKSMLEGMHVLKSGTVRIVDMNGKEVERLEFVDALIREISFPAVDARSKEPARLKIKIAPKSARRVPGSGAPAQLPPVRVKQRALASNFRLEIDDVDCSRVSAIESVTVRQRVEEIQVGSHFELEPAGLEIGDLVVAAASVSDDFEPWLKDLVVNGDMSAEKAGQLELLAPDLKRVLFKLTFAGLGIFSLKREYIEKDGVSRLNASIYCEKVGMATGDPALLKQDLATPA